MHLLLLAILYGCEPDKSPEAAEKRRNEANERGSVADSETSKSPDKLPAACEEMEATVVSDADGNPVKQGQERECFADGAWGVTSWKAGKKHGYQIRWHSHNTQQRIETEYRDGVSIKATHYDKSGNKRSAHAVREEQLDG